MLSGGRQHHHDLAPSMVLERPKVLYNDLTRTFVMWMHIDDADYAMARAGKHRNLSKAFCMPCGSTLAHLLLCVQRLYSYNV